MLYPVSSLPRFSIKLVIFNHFFYVWSIYLFSAPIHTGVTDHLYLIVYFRFTISNDSATITNVYNVNVYNVNMHNIIAQTRDHDKSKKISGSLTGCQQQYESF